MIGIMISSSCFLKIKLHALSQVRLRSVYNDFYRFFYGQFVVRCLKYFCVNRCKFVCSRFIAIGAVSVWFTSSSVITDTWQGSPECQPGQFVEPLTWSRCKTSGTEMSEYSGGGSSSGYIT